MDRLITITTDFGDDFAAAQLKAVLASLDFNGGIIENHSVSPYSVLEGAFQILTLSKFTPAKTIHLGVVDPGVGSHRKGIIIKTKNYLFVGPDNGLLYPAALNDGIDDAYQIKESEISNEISKTFHGRDIFIKVAACLAHGKTSTSLGATKIGLKDIKKITFRRGQVIHIDYYGNVKIYWPKELIPGQKLSITITDNKINIPITETFSDVKPKCPLALLGSSDTLELAVNRGNASSRYGIKLGDILKIDE